MFGFLALSSSDSLYSYKHTASFNATSDNATLGSELPSLSSLLPELALSLVILATVGALLPHARKARAPRAPPPTTPRSRASAARDPSRDRFKAAKLPEAVEYVVVGSGVSGLFSAAVLAKLG